MCVCMYVYEVSLYWDFRYIHPTETCVDVCVLDANVAGSLHN